MVSAVSSQTATLNLLASTAQADDDATKQAAPDVTAYDADRGPATQVSLSQEALDKLIADHKQNPDAARQTMDAFTQPSEQRSGSSAEQAQDSIAKAFASKLQEVADRRGITVPEGQSLDSAYLSDQIKLQGFLRFFEGQKDQLAARQTEYDRLSSMKPVPQQELTGKAKDAALELLSSRGYVAPGPNHSIGFAVGNLYYHFYGDDGSVKTNEIGVPTSEAEKQTGLATLNRLIQFSQQDVSDIASLRGDELNRRIDDLYRQLGPSS
ncbi:hypothetical protein [Bradyrhizobium sp. SYSU BS000235]|uniref:hypothetical protein n=1 Tax=Bradyrhizobium sp. SYSU BS000235 TaxID=3411332 RepID=UPI003C75F8BA